MAPKTPLNIIASNGHHHVSQCFEVSLVGAPPRWLLQLPSKAPKNILDDHLLRREGLINSAILRDSQTIQPNRLQLPDCPTKSSPTPGLSNQIVSNSRTVQSNEL
ncbi:unnamed protein product [Cyprideis torosa]|uniref:Uncharacterized protein n=1 Tax=Cyprideis torosa TaxID=163714 RepID=A0A7R8ZU33_9CRUS|nr:unnamed protein product [Cyprideis torosa]CAG0905249.1 unnamed protein product [Cyprideis torosa]